MRWDGGYPVTRPVRLATKIHPTELLMTDLFNLRVGYFLTPNFVASVEARNENSHSALFDSSVLYLGPTVSLVNTHYWFTLAVQPQVVALQGSTGGSSLDLSQNEHLQTRLLLGFPL